jgi:hypothetical protein
MRSSTRPIAMIVLLTSLLIPGLLSARTIPVRPSERTAASAPAPEIFSAFSSVWNLLTRYFKSGGQMDPNGAPAPPTPPSISTTADNGGQIDPNGGPK